MARYEKGGADFAQEQFAKARDYREEQAKQQEKFAKNLQRANLALTGANWFINEKADALENSRVVENSWWQTQLESAQATQKRISDYEAQGLSRQQMYEADIRGQLDEYLQGDEADGKIVYTNIQDGIEQVVEEFKKNQVSFDAWNKSIDAQLNIPNITKEDAIAAARVEGGKAPRSLGALFGNKIYKTYKSHTAETLAQEDKNAKERIVGSLVGEQFKAAREAVRAYGETGSPISSLAKYIKDNPETVQKYNQETVQMEVTEFTNPETNTNDKLITTLALVNGKMTSVGSETIKGAPILSSQLTFNRAEQVAAYGAISNSLEGTAAGDAFVKAYPDEVSQLGFANTALGLQQQILKISGGDLSPALALNVAGRHLVNNKLEGNPSYGTMTLYDIDSALEDITGENQIDTSKMQQYIDSIKKEIKNENLRQIEIDRVVENMALDIDASFEGDEKITENIQLDRVLAINNLASLEERQQALANSFSENSPEKTFYDDVKDYAYIGPVAELMFGEELDWSDGIWLFPGAGILGGGIRIAGKAMMPRIAQGLTSSKVGQRFFNKLKMKNFNPDNLTRLEKAMYNSLSKSGKSLDVTTLTTELLKIPGVAFKGTVGQNKLIYGGSLLALGKSGYESVNNEDED